MDINTDQLIIGLLVATLVLIFLLFVTMMFLDIYSKNLERSKACSKCSNSDRHYKYLGGDDEEMLITCQRCGYSHRTSTKK